MTLLESWELKTRPKDKVYKGLKTRPKGGRIFLGECVFLFSSILLYICSYFSFRPKNNLRNAIVILKSWRYSIYRYSCGDVMLFRDAIPESSSEKNEQKMLWFSYTAVGLPWFRFFSVRFGSVLIFDVGYFGSVQVTVYCLYFTSKTCTHNVNLYIFSTTNIKQ